jgi:hypothetical protein
MANGKRRGVQEWSRLVRAWKRSGLRRAEFAATHGIAASTLSWWKWRLDRARAAAATTRRSERDPPAVKLVRVEVQGEEAEQAPARVAWELESPSGHTLRVYEGAGGESLRAAIEMLSRSESDR